MLQIDQNSNGIAMVQLNRGKVNALDQELCERLIESFEQLASSPFVKGVVLSGNSSVFSAGIDLKSLTSRETGFLANHLPDFLPTLSACFKCLFQFKKPLVGAIGGHAIAGGAVLAACCDHRLIGEDVNIGLPEKRIGVALPSSAIEILRFATLPAAFRRMLNSGGLFYGEAAVAVGLADQVVAQGLVLESAMEKALSLAELPADVFEITKSQMRAPIVRQIAENERLFEGRIQEIWMSESNQKVIERYVAQRL